MVVDLESGEHPETLSNGIGLFRSKDTVLFCIARLGIDQVAIPARDPVRFSRRTEEGKKILYRGFPSTGEDDSLSL
jgi:hypothetical protein